MKIKWQELFNHMSQDHGLDLLETEMNDIAVIIKRPLLSRIKELEDDVERLIEHSAVLGLDLRGGDCADASTESWISLPEHLQDAMNIQVERIDAEDEK